MERQALRIKEVFPIYAMVIDKNEEERKEMAHHALENILKRKGKKPITGFLQARNRTFHFYVIFIQGDRYRFLRLLVTNRFQLQAMKKMYPENTPIAVSLIETLESVENKIINAIDNRNTKH